MNYNFILLLFLLCIKSHYYYAINICEYKKMKSHNSPEIYWINMDKSIERRDAMQKHLDEMGVVHHRFRALTNDEILIPDDIDQTWNHADRALFQTKNIPPSKIHGTKSEISSYSKYSAYISGLFGRRRSNRLKEIGCTVSHILAMKEAVNSKTSKSKYALIIEDDVHFPFDIDFDEMVASVSLTYPGKTFGIYQLFNSNEPTLKDRYNKYQHGGERNRIKNLWLEKFPWQPAQFWSTCAYLIDRKALKPVLETIIIEHEGWKDFKLIAGLRKSCSPVGSICCPNNTYDFSHNPPCILAPKGFQADSFLYSLANSIILSIPVIANGHGGNQSTFHQDHVETIHASSFRTMRSFINEMFVGNTTMPNFIKSPCIEPKLYQSIALKLTIAPPCNYLFLQKSALPLNKHNIVEIFWINYEKSQSHIAKTKDHLKSIGILSFTQVISGITVEEMYIPVDVLFNWETAKCMSKSDRIKGVKPMEDKYLISGLCGRGNNINTLEDLSITLSHMLAIKKAVYSTSSSSKYALIIEDDISFVFDIDLNLLGDSAPIDFGILQLSGVDGRYVQRAWVRYSRSNGEKLWEPHASYVNSHVANSFSASVYLINREIMKPVVDSMISSTKGWKEDFKILAGLHAPCVPFECCSFGVMDNTRRECVVAKNGFYLTSFLPSLRVPYYTSTLPMFKFGILDQLSNWNLNRVKSIVNSLVQSLDYFSHGFNTQRVIMNEMNRDLNRLPKFLSFACKSNVNESIFVG